MSHNDAQRVHLHISLDYAVLRTLVLLFGKDTDDSDLVAKLKAATATLTTSTDTLEKAAKENTPST